MLPMPKYKNHMRVDLACCRERHASETIHGLGSRRREYRTPLQSHTNLAGSKCRVCNEIHPIWRWEEFKTMEVGNRWFFFCETR